MNDDGKNRSFRMPLIEIVIVVAVFVLISVLLLKLYVAADSLQGSAENVSSAVIAVQSVGEVIKSSTGVEEAVRVLDFSHDTVNDNSSEDINVDNYIGNYNGINISVSFREEKMKSGEMVAAVITAFSHNNDELCQITVKKFNQ